MSPSTHDQELRVLVLAPYGRDGQVTCEVLHDAGIESLRCEDIDQLCAELRRGAGVMVIAAEALHPASMPHLVAALAEQPTWSDLPVVLATSQHQAPAVREWTLAALAPARHITLLERPIRIQTLISVVRSALITRQRQYEVRELLEQLRLNVQRLDAEHAVRERFVNLLAHDLRGPLGVGKMSAELLGYRPDNPAQVQALARRIGTSIDRADKMIRNLLDAHRLRAGQQLPLERSRCDLVEIARDVTSDLEDAECARVSVQGPDSVEGYWDADLLWRAVWNLVTNAIKYGAAESPITVSLQRADAEAVARVHNHGPSISAEEQRRLLEPFSRTHDAQAGAQQGWGLGLTLVEGVASSHGGKLEVSSEPESGTAFTLRLPLGDSGLPAGN